jgi:hypothetical protein
VAGSGEHDNEPPRSIKGGEFLYRLSDCQILKKDQCNASVLYTEI